MMPHTLKSNRLKKQILIVDDHALIRRGLATLINDQEGLEVCGEAASTREAMTVAGKTHPDLAILDVSLKDGSGLDLIKQLKSLYPAIKILISSMHDEELFAERALHAGAMGYIEKDADEEILVGAIRQILQGKIYLSEAMRERIIQGIGQPGQDPTRAPIDTLTNREMEIFQLISQGQGTSRIAETLHLSVHTIETHRENIKKKLKLQSGLELNRYAAQWIMEQQ